MINKLSGTINYPLFKYYSIAIIEWLKTLSPLYRRLSKGETEGRNIIVIYGNPERMFSSSNMMRNPMYADNERIRSPIISVYLSSLEPQPGYNIPRKLNFFRPQRLPNGRINVMDSFFVKKLDTYSLTYTVDVSTAFKSDMDFILYTILSQLDNGKTKWLLFIDDETGDPAYFPFELSSVSDTSTYDPGNAADISIRSSIQFRVPWAYLPVSFTKYVYDIGKTAVANMINTNLEAEFDGSMESEKARSEINHYENGEIEIKDK